MNNMDEYEVWAQNYKEEQPEQKYTDIRDVYSGNDEYKAVFDTYDKNKDNVIDQQEAQQVPELDTQSEFSAADTDNDNLITKQEFEPIVFDLNKYRRQLVDKNTGHYVTQVPDNDVEHYNEAKNAIDAAMRQELEQNEQAATSDEEKEAWDYDTMDFWHDIFRESGWGKFNPETGEDYLIQDEEALFDEDGNITPYAKEKLSKDKGLAERIRKYFYSDDTNKIVEAINALQFLPKYSETEKYQRGKDLQERWAGVSETINTQGADNVDWDSLYVGLGEVGDTGEVWQETLEKNMYSGLARLSMEQLKEISEKTDKISWKRVANAFAGQDKEVSKKWYANWKKLNEKEKEVKKVITGLNDKISPVEVEQIAYEDLMERTDDKVTKDGKDKETTETTPIQETTVDNRTETIKQAIKHIVNHGKSLPKDMKKKLQDIPYKFEPVDFTGGKKATSTKKASKESLDIDDSNQYYGVTASGGASSVPHSFLGGGTGGTGGSVASGKGKPQIRKTSGSTGSRGGGMSLPTEPQQARISLGTDTFSIGEFSSKKKPINIRMRKPKGGGKSRFPDLSPVVDNHNDMNVPKQSKLARPIIKNGLYQDVDDKYDSDIYSKIIDYVVNNYKDWDNKDGMYMLEVSPLNIKIYYDTVSQPKIKYQSGQAKNISSLLKEAGGKQVLTELYKYVQGGAK